MSLSDSEPTEFSATPLSLSGPVRLTELAVRIAHRLPEAAGLLNLCENRVWFTATLLATAIRRIPCLLPPNRADATLERLAAAHGPLIAARDREIALPLPSLKVSACPDFPGSQWDHWSLADLQVIAFTSGSTGKPQPWPKDWQTLSACARLALEALGLQRRRWAVIATAPAQHMYGLETAVVWPLCSELALTGRLPFYPEDVRRAIAESPQPVLLVSTPVHLKACLAGSMAWPNLAAIVSSTAPLDPELALELESVTGRPLWEIYGSTETLSFAWRRPATESLWRLYPGARLHCHSDDILLEAPWLSAPVALADRLEVAADGRFRVVGRHKDLIKIGGKRASLAELNWHLNRIAGVDDGCFFATDQGRVGALVVSRRPKAEILAALRQRLDEVFLPRPLYLVPRLPRNATGKIVKAELDQLLRQLRAQTGQ